MRFWKEDREEYTGRWCGEGYEDGEQIVFRCEKDMKTRGQEGAEVEHVGRAWMIIGALPWPRRREARREKWRSRI